MATELDRIQVAQGLEADRATFTFMSGEFGWTTDTKRLYIGDGATAGGFRVAMYADLTGAIAGFVSATAGNLTSNALVLGAGTKETKVAAGFTTDGTSKLTLGVAGTSVGGLLLTNATSGTVELRPVAGALGTSVISIPAATDTMVLLTAAQSLTNKKLGSLTTNGLVTTSGADGTLSVTVPAANVLTFLATPSSANLAAAVIDETGTGVLVFGTSPTFTTDLTTPKVIWTTSVFDSSGSGSPEGVVTANIGSTFRRTNGGASTTFYVKESGTGNTGWVAHGTGGGGGSPGGSTTQLQYNNAGAFGGISGATTNGTVVTFTTTNLVAADLYIDSTGPVINMKLSASSKGLMGVAISAGNAITGTATNDFYLRATTALMLGTNGGDPQLKLLQTASTVNYATIAGSTGTNAVIYGADGTGASVGISLEPKAGGNVRINGTSPALFFTLSGTNKTLLFNAISTNNGITGSATDDFGIRLSGNFIVSGDGGTSIGLKVISSTNLVQMPKYGVGTATFDASGNISSVSDSRVKNNVRAFTRGLADVVKLRPVLHGYTKESGLDQTKDDYAGFLAQEVQSIIPEAVGQSPGGLLSFSDRPVIAALVNAVKELESEIVFLKSKLAA